MIGVTRERARSRISFAVSKPSMRGIRTSSRITARSWLSAQRRASSPESASRRFWSRLPSSSRRAYKFFGSSSTRRMLALRAPSIRCRGCGRAEVKSLYELLPDGVMHQLRVVAQPELAENPGPVGAYRARAQRHLLRDLVDLLAGGEQPHHAVLPVREPLVQLPAGIARELGREQFRERRADVLAAACNFPHGLGQFLRCAFLGDVARPSGLQNPRRMELFRMNAQDQDRAPRKLPFQVVEQVESAAARHGKVQDRNVPLDRASERERFVAVCRLAPPTRSRSDARTCFHPCPTDRWS